MIPIRDKRIEVNGKMMTIEQLWVKTLLKQKVTENNISSFVRKGLQCPICKHGGSLIPFKNNKCNCECCT